MGRSDGGFAKRRVVVGFGHSKDKLGFTPQVYWLLYDL